MNAYIDSHRGGLGLAFVVTGMKAGIGGVGGYDLEPWTALDSLAWQKVQAWQLGGNFDSEVFRMLADEKLGDPKLTDALFPAYKDTMPVITPSSQAATGPTTPMDAAASSPATAATPATDAAWRGVATTGQRILAIAGLDAGGGLVGDHQVGSNDWVIAPSKSKSGGALLANDPHLGIACRRSGS